MRLIRHLASTALLTILVVAFVSPASAQQIRRYGDNNAGGDTAASSSSSSSGGAKAWYPGMPVPQQSNGGGQQQAADQQQAGQEGGAEGEEQLSTSHRITIFSGKNQGPNSPRTTLDMAVDQLYRGVIPGTRDEVAHLSRAKKDGASEAKKNQLTWLGFRPTDEHTRVFFQTARKADYHIRRKQNPAVIEITVKNTKISARNFSRFIDTSFFNRNVKRVEAKKVDSSTVEIIIELEKFEQPTVRQDGSYVYLDFPHTAPAKKEETEKVAGQNQGQP
ncbi:AMIN domain-containing protein [Persicimonas caeni]|uniref:AMIN domain-containing protein n=1 Tax=Persicimonas caeni TaxID=2292766 RepID=A0A4Y6Q271_PERCE|nr:AMIN domain-containing protein [Persicimonas caeni]QDG54530.1 AMIN domain-containing protein [Persicimonas caeni]QED35751.1 AMIN domain-containing protein [Persicimonas caeni]